ncbi:hypothetical protein GCM10023259_078340 [Thermocatellispora tengchongensis]
MHAVGGGDLGLAGARDWTGAPVDIDGDPQATGTDLRPLRKVLAGLAAAKLPVSLIALLGTTTPGGPAGRSFAEHAEEIRARLVSPNGLFGARFEPGAVAVVPVQGPTLSHTTDALRRWLDGRTPDDILVTCGSGAYALSAGALCAALESRRSARILDIAGAERSYTLGPARGMDTYLESWLLRHRFWDALAEIDPDHAPLWELLAARQAGNIDRAAALTSRPDRLPGIEIERFTKPWPIAQAALFERLGRGEAADHGLLRAWFAHQLHKFFNNEETLLSPRNRDLIADLIDVLGDRNSDQGGLAGKIRTASRETRGDHESAAVAMLRDNALVDLYREAATHQAHLKPDPAEPGPLPPVLLAAADRWEKDDHTVNLVTGTGRTCWPVLGSGDVLALMAVGLDRDGRDGEDHRAILAVITDLRRRQQHLLRPGALKLRLLASPETQDRAHRLSHWATRDTDATADVRVIGGVTGDLLAVRDSVTTALAAEAPPTGRRDSGSLRDIDELVLVLNPGPPMTNYGMISAGVEWSLTAACPLRITELTRRPDGLPELRGGAPVLAGLGADHMLTALAVSAVRRLDLRTARRLVERMSEPPREVLPRLKRLESDLYGPAGRDWREADRIRHARRRLRLIRDVGERHLIPMAYLAVEALRPALFPWHVWTRLQKACPVLKTLGRMANDTVQGHALDRYRRGIWRPERHDVRELLAQAMVELGGPGEGDDVLVKQYGEVIARLSGGG